jgi:Flp pilus assembly protein TadG
MILSRARPFAGRQLAALVRDIQGVAMLEFALAMPLVIAVSCYGLEVANLALLNLRISQIALALADNASRVGTYSSLSTQQLREIDVDDIFAASRYQGSGINLTTNGRVILSSLENIQQSYDKTAPVQRIHWQRCLGLKTGTGYDSSYGTTTVAAGTTNTQANAGTAVPNGMGVTGAQVTAPSGSGVMFVEINYLTKPLFGTLLVSPTRIHYVASFIVRDQRDYSQLFNPATATQMTCDRPRA